MTALRLAVIQEGLLALHHTVRALVPLLATSIAEHIGMACLLGRIPIEYVLCNSQRRFPLLIAVLGARITTPFPGVSIQMP